MIDQAITELVQYGLDTGLVAPEDKIFVTNQILEALGLESYEEIPGSMGAEELEETEFAPMFASCEPCLKDKKIGLFGSYGWGDGEWMRKWEQTCRDDGAILVCDSVICNEAPDADAVVSCEAMGNALANA